MYCEFSIFKSDMYDNNGKKMEELGIYTYKIATLHGKYKVRGLNNKKSIEKMKRNHKVKSIKAREGKKIRQIE